MLTVIPLSDIKKYPNAAIRRFRQVLVCSGILLCDSRVLLVKRGDNSLPAPGTWALPGGHIEPLERPEEAACREFLEETNVKVKAVRLVGIEHYFYDDNDLRTHIIEFIYEVKSTQYKQAIKLDSEHSEYTYADVADLGGYPSLVGPRKRAIKKVFNKQT